jgi:hypothetical protein
MQRIFLLDWDLASVGYIPAYFDWRMNASLVTGRNTLSNIIFVQEVTHTAYEPFFGSTSSTHDHDVIELSGNRAMLRTLLSEPGYDWWSAKLDAIGLNTSHGFGCLMHGLFLPSPAVNRFLRTHARSALDSSVFLVGVHLRTGDENLFRVSRAGSLDSTLLRRAVDVGMNKSRSYAILFVSDSVEVREDARRWARASNVTVIVPRIIPKHINPRPSFLANPHERDILPRSTSVDSILSAVSEWWLLASCHVTFLLSSSGFSRTAAAFSMRDIIVSYGDDYVLHTHSMAECVLSHCLGCTSL